MLNNNEPYIDRFGFEIDPAEKVPVLIKLSIMVYGLEYTDSRMQSVVTVGNNELSRHYGDTDREVLGLARAWIHDKFNVPDEVVFYYRDKPGP